jgi:hypothetical protein
MMPSPGPSPSDLDASPRLPLSSTLASGPKGRAPTFWEAESGRMTISWVTVPALVTRNVTLPPGTVAWSTCKPMAPGCIMALPSPIGPPESVSEIFTTEAPGAGGAEATKDPELLGRGPSLPFEPWEAWPGLKLTMIAAEASTAVTATAPATAKAWASAFTKRRLMAVTSFVAGTGVAVGGPARRRSCSGPTAASGGHQRNPTLLGARPSTLTGSARTVSDATSTEEGAGLPGAPLHSIDLRQS